jgi:transcriptional regulator with XRE-family HTH domain
LSFSRTRSRHGPSLTTAELTQRRERLRRRRLQRGLTLADAAAELEIPAKSLRAIEWDRADLLASPGDADRIERQYAAFLGLEEAPPPAETAEAPASPRRVRRAVWIPLLAGLTPLLVIGLVYGLGEVVGEGEGDGDGLNLGELQLLPVALVLLSSLLLVGAALPPNLVARTSVPPASFARYRQPLALAGIGILVSVAVFTLLVALT